ncbi:MAG: nucleotidyltransferase family protein [Candidatus Acidiferrales bacterium]
MTAGKEITSCLEKQMLVACARTRMTPENARCIREIAAQPIDWDYLLHEAEANSITPLLHRHLTSIVADSPPSAFKEQLSQANRANVARSLSLTAELIKILDLFRSHKVSVIPYKGPVLAAQAYGDVTLREFEDLDLVLSQPDLPQAHWIMLALGYKAKFDWILSTEAVASVVPAEYAYRDEARRLLVELHTEVTLRHFPVKPDLDDFTRHLVPVRLGDRGVLTFSAEDTLPIICIHGSKHFWERISWIADVSELIQSLAMADWDRSIRVAEYLKAGRILHVGLALAQQMLDAPLPGEILARVRSDQVAVEVASKIQRRLIGREFRTLDTGGRFRFRRQMQAGFIDGWRYASRLAVVPAEEDWEMLHLPPVLAPLYIALRPIRLLRKYGWRGIRAPKPTS